MKETYKPYLKISLGLLVAAIMLFISACGNKDERPKTELKTTYTDTISVEIEKASIKELNITKTFAGTLEGEEQANIVSKIPERIMEIKVRVGEFVNAGSVVFLLDKGGASSQYYQAQAVFLNAQKDLERMKSLFNEGAVSRQMLDGTQTAYDVAKANFEAAKSTVELTSPLSGVVTSLNVNVGDIANPGIVMATVANISRMKALFNVGESDVPNFFTGQSAEIYSELNPEIVQTGKLVQISKSADIQSRTFEMKALFTNTKDRWFKPGMFCKVKVNLQTKKGSLVIPYASIIDYENERGIFAVNNGKASFRKIETGITDGKYIEVLSGLNEGEEVVTLGMNNLKEGTVVILSNK
jgi:RND family efflux transporter MFP subunit